jgi:RHS repeat-associated protein
MIIKRCTDRSLRLFALATSAFFASGSASSGQTCTPQIMQVSVSPANSTPPEPFFSGTVDYWGGPATFQSTWDSWQLQLHHPGTYSFSAGGYGYLGAETAPDAFVCTQPTGQCLACTGGYEAELHGAYGNINGTVRMIPGNTIPPAVPALQVTTFSGPLGAFTPLTAGSFNFIDTQPNGPAFGANGWSLRVDQSTPPGLPGVRTYNLGIYQDINTRWAVGTAVVRSDETTTVQLSLPASYFEEELRPGCSIPGAPAGPSNVGRPVNVANGNVYLDQQDAAVPGVAGALRFVRSYNSQARNAGQYGRLGVGWNHTYERRFTFPATGIIAARADDGNVAYYEDVNVPDGTYVGSTPCTKESWIVKESETSYVMHFRKGGSESYERPGGVGGARLVSIVDPSGNETELQYSGANLTTITDSGSRALTLGYTSDRLTSIAGPAGLIAAFTYKPTIALLETVTYADGNADGQPDGAYTFAYDGLNRLLTVTDGSLRVVETHSYDSSHRAQTNAIAGDVEKYTFNYNAGSSAYRTSVTDKLDNVATYDWNFYNGNRRVTKIVGPCLVCGTGEGHTQTWSYDSAGRTTSHTDRGGNRTEYTYTADGDLETIRRWSTPTQEHLTSFSYYPDGRVHTETAPNGAVTTYTYVVAGPETVTTTVTPTVSRQYSFLYTPQGQLWKSTDPRLKVTEFSYTAAGDLDWVKSHLGNTTSYTYDLMGRRTKTILPATTPPNDSPVTSYDALGRVWKVTNPNGSYWQYGFDGGGHRTSVRDPLGRVTTSTYDAWGRLWKVLDANTPAGETEYGYDLMSRLTSLTDARDKTTSFEYDSYGRTKKVTYPGSRSEHFTYTATGKVETHTDRRGIATLHEYDGLDRLTSRGGPPGTHFGYDANGDLGFMTSAQNSADTLTWNYDLSGQMLSESSTLNLSTVSYEYDAAGNRTVLKLNGVEVSTSGYDDDSRLGTITRPGLAPFVFGYDSASRRRTLTYPNGVVASYDYDALSRVTGISATHAGAALDNLGYDYNDLDERLWAGRQNQAGHALNLYGYDALSRLGTVQHSFTPACAEPPCDPPPAPLPTETYSYDAVGNRLSALYVPGTWTYSDRNELESYAGLTLGYDLNGNQTSESGTTRAYNWNEDNRLDSVYVDNEFRAQFLYDPLGRRVSKFADDGSKGGPELTSYVYDGDDILRRADATGTNLYLHGPGVDEPLLQESSTAGRSYLHADALGSIRWKSNQSGAIVASYDYDTFGKASGLPDGYSYTGREWDSEIGIYYYRARYYDPRTGRFIGEDPLRFGGGVNFYAYVDANPVNLIDPFGLVGGATAMWGDQTFWGDFEAHNYNVLQEQIRFCESMGATYPCIMEAGVPSLTSCKIALRKVHELVGKLRKGRPGKFGSPQRGNSELGYRLDPPHPRAPADAVESGAHFNWWDFRKGKWNKGRGPGRKGGVKIDCDGCE